jgi:hypothetical protein
MSRADLEHSSPEIVGLAVAWCMNVYPRIIYLFRPLYVKRT